MTAGHLWTRVAQDRLQWKSLEEAYAKRQTEIRDILWEYHEKPKIRGHFPKIVLRELLDEEQLEERIQASGNVIANIQDITLREELLSEGRLPVEGFGEENANQALQMLNNRTLEVMMAGDEALGQVSGVDVTNLQDMDKSKDPTKLQADVHMEQMPNLDITSFRHYSVMEEKHLLESK
ncbi:hypothetical protein EVAR_14777_1 [Eumeta japonica]|uniref:Uncharacterized protein n=1 Tax=Eumeta variegata TaxID=151549 RepID=A0A4C1TWX7_EUMVA|nr:hypothetical protein EVAR_14777_1 [Eumeta japonica]